MDSANSGSLQSSSGAEEECDSRAAAHPPFLTNLHHHPQPFDHLPFDHHNQINHPFFFTPTPHNPLHNLDSILWSKTLPSPDPITHTPFFQPDPKLIHHHNTIPPVPPPLTTAAPITSADHPPPGRNPKKRSRASRRAPTTVLTTDTTNFRAMVQEFTGIPAPPFPAPSSSSAFSRVTSLDLFRSNHVSPPQLPPFLLHKLQSTTSSSSSVSSLLNHSIINNNNLLRNMQNQTSFPSNFLNTKDNSDMGFIGNDHIHGLQAAMPGLVASDGTAPASATATATMMDNQGGGHGVSFDYGGGKGSAAAADRHVSGMRGEGLMEPWICSSSD